ncbi:MAG TPA: hypothetical protein VK629_09310 [Steroidobacteraceae bacterium]|nr:hypothetical protein [Steroidobacteraceae bacterium]
MSTSASKYTKIVWLIVLSIVSGCARHSSIDHLYPEYVDKDVLITQAHWLIEVTIDEQSSHPAYELSFVKPQYETGGQLLEIPQASVLRITGFYTHDRFTESGTEVRGWVILRGKKYDFYMTLNHSYDGVKKVSGLPWIAA